MKYDSIHHKAKCYLALLEQTWGAGNDATEYIAEYINLMQELHEKWNGLVKELEEFPQPNVDVEAVTAVHMPVRKSHEACETYTVNSIGCLAAPCPDCDLNDGR